MNVSRGDDDCSQMMAVMMSLLQEAARAGASSQSGAQPPRGRESLLAS